MEILKKTYNKYNIEGVLWVHIGGIITPDFHEVAEFCKKNGIILIEDCAHAHGSFFKGKSAGTFGNGGAFSFFPTKVMTTMEGGMIITDNDEHADLVKSFRNQGKRKAAYGGLHYDLGNSWRINEIQAYMGIILLRKLDLMVGKRQQAVDKITNKLKSEDIDFCDTSHMEKASQYKFIINLKEGMKMEEIKKQLSDKGIYCGGKYMKYLVICNLFLKIPINNEELQNTTLNCPMHICPLLHQEYQLMKQTTLLMN